ncbi:MAG: MotA/TolQ/ExbB proton channel family protein [Spirochaetes bacterium]|nr:MotA/TolQ/ExbB proton channel family protein [Spirochaetota bacterium]
MDVTKDIVANIPPDTSITLLEFFKLGGWAMWPLLIFSIATISLIIERVIFIFSHNLSMKIIHKKVLAYIKNNDFDGAREYCKNFHKKTVGASIILEGLRMAELGEHRMEKAIEAEAAERINHLESGFNFLIALGSIAPITGFLGTVSGMISAFKSIANAADVNAQLVAGGIFEALITTAFGLSIAIVAITGYNIFSHFVDKFTADVEQVGSDVITSILVRDKKI